MAVMGGLYLVSCLVMVLLAAVSRCQTDVWTDRRIHNLETELAKLRMLHQQSKDRLKFVEKELNHYFTIYQGVELLCSTLKDYKPVPPPTTPPTPTVKPVPTVSGITAFDVETVISSMGKTNVVQVTVHYLTTEPHSVIWAYNVMGHMVPVRAGDPYASSREARNGESLQTTLTIGEGDLASLELLYVKILSEFSEVTLLFNTSSLLTGEGTQLSPLRIGNEEPAQEVLLIRTGQPVNLTLKLDTNLNNLIGYVNYIGINASSRVNPLIDVQVSDPRIGSVLRNTTRGYLWSVNVDASLVELGGMLSMRVVETFTKGPVVQLHVGKTMYVISDKPGLFKSPFPQNSLALLSLYRHTGRTISTKPPVVAIWCYAFGNPVPRTSIYKLSMSGRKTQLEGHVYNIGKYDAARVAILNNISVRDEGTYLCEAISGNNTVGEIVNLYIPNK